MKGPWKFHGWEASSTWNSTFWDGMRPSVRTWEGECTISTKYLIKFLKRHSLTVGDQKGPETVCQLDRLVLLLVCQLPHLLDVCLVLEMVRVSKDIFVKTWQLQLDHCSSIKREVWRISNENHSQSARGRVPSGNLQQSRRPWMTAPLPSCQHTCPHFE